MTATDTELEAFVAEQLAQPCEVEYSQYCPTHGGVRLTPCEEPATWILRNPCACGYSDVVLVCDDHAAKARGADDWVVVCVACGCPAPLDRIVLERL